ncbi:MAG: polysulfide reductase NrfD [Magnetococcales bacterium]|nr:polysulfide reductase NrfD [Magnetococcales bacterium]
MITVLLALMAWGGSGYRVQLDQGLTVTGLTDQVLWGLYIGNFTFLVGVAASAVILLAPACLLGRPDLRPLVPLGEAVAVAAVAMSLAFVLVDLGRPLRFWHAVPLLGKLNWPGSIMAWDMGVLLGYLLLNLVLIGLTLRAWRLGREIPHRRLAPWMLLAVGLGIAIHVVTAFLLAGLPARPLWHSAALAPRFIASAFAAGSALMIVILAVIQGVVAWVPPPAARPLLARMLAAALLIDLLLLGAEGFGLFYPAGGHGAALQRLFQADPVLGVWLTTGLVLSGTAALLAPLPRVRASPWLLHLVCVLAFVGIWMEKGLGLVVPGFLPTPLGEVATYRSSLVEIQVTVGIWAAGILLFLLLVRRVLARMASRSG